MARSDPTRRDPASYPHSAEVQTRFQDLDPLGHINNVAMGALFESGRVRFNRELLRERKTRAEGVRWLIARVDIQYLAEAHFPAPLHISNAIAHVGNTSWTMVSAAFQDGTCVALCDTVIVYCGPDGPMPLPDAFREELGNWMLTA